MKKRNCKSLVFSGLCFFVASAGLANANPAISSLSSTQVNHSAEITIKGSGFGKKKQAAPVLYDFATFAYENGQLNEHHSNYSDYQTVSRLSNDPQAIWHKPSTTAGGASTPSVVRSLKPRHQYSTGHYYFEGKQGWLGWPAAYGGSATPVDNQQLYVSWWYKPKYDPRYYWQVPLNNAKGTFAKGESVELSTGVTGEVVAIEGGMMHAIFYDQKNGNNLVGARIKGKKSGAEATIPSTGLLNPGSNKYLRVWEDPAGNEGIRMSWTQNQFGANGTNPWVYAPVVAGQWNLMEMMLDSKKGKAWIKVNAKDVFELDFGTQADLIGKYSPTIGLIGFDGKHQTHQTHEMSEIYMDSTFQRVLIGNAATYDAVTHYEVQMPISWTETEVKIKVNLGALNQAGAKYLYVVDAAGNVNKNGYKLCDSCSAPPVAPVLKVSN